MAEKKNVLPTSDAPVPGTVRLNSSAQLAKLDEENRTFEMAWYAGARIIRGFFEQYYLEFDMRGCDLSRLNSGRAPFLDSHSSWNTDTVLGVIERAWIEGGKGMGTVRFSRRPEVEGKWIDIRDGILRNVSMGVNIREVELLEKKEGNLPVYRATSWEPHEVSCVSVGADPNAATLSAGDGQELGMFLKNMAMKGGVRVNQEELNALVEQLRQENEELKKQLKNGGKAAAEEDPKDDGAEEEKPPKDEEAGNDPEDKEEAAQNGKETQLSASEVAKLVKLGAQAGLPSSEVQSMIDRKLSFDQAVGCVFELRNEGTAGIRSTGQGRVTTGAAEGEKLKAAAAHALLSMSDPGTYKPEQGSPFNGMRLMDQAREALHRSGERTQGLSNAQIAELAMTRSDFPKILTDVVNKSLRNGYSYRPPTFKAFARQASVPDFRDKISLMLGGTTLEEVLEHGEYIEGALSESEEKYRVRKYGRILSITFETIVNDDLDALTRVPQKLGAAAQNLESTLVYELLMSNPKMSDGNRLFSTAHGNLGSGTTLDPAGLAKAYQAMFAQADDIGEAINVEPRHLVTGADLYTTARQLTSLNYQPADQAGINVVGPMLSPIGEARVKPTLWMLAADAGQIDGLEYAYLSGYEGPTVETKYGFEVDGILYKIRHIFGAGVTDWRGFWANKGPETI